MLLFFGRLVLRFFKFFPWYFNLLSSFLDGLGGTGGGERLDNLTEFVVGIFLNFFQIWEVALYYWISKTVSNVMIC